MHLRERRILSYPAVECEPLDWLCFVQLDPFPRKWEQLGLDDEDLRSLEIMIMTLGGDSRYAPVIKGTGGLRKLRFSSKRDSTGKRGGYRVCFAHLVEYGVVLLITVYGKNEAIDLSTAGKAAIAAVLASIREQLDRGVIQ
jgi:hypothetical protein